MVNGAPDPVFAKDREGRLVLLNAATARVFGVGKAAALGRRDRDLLPAEQAAAIEDIDRRVMATGEAHVVEETVTEPGKGPRVFVSAKAPWRDAQGRVMGVVGIARDTTEQQKAEARLREMQAEVLHVSRLSEMGALATALAHELNQPLTAVANFADAARRLLAGGTAAADPDLLEAARGAMADAVDQAVRAGRIVRRLREFVGRGDTDKRPSDVDALVEESAALALVGARERGVEARLEFDPGIPPVLADRLQIQQVVVNLVRNAVEAMQDAPRRELIVATAMLSDERAVAINVADTGPGLAEEVVARLFEPFVTTKRQGMGVGLSICSSIIESHGGRLTAAPNPGGGTVFRVALPALPDPLAPPGSAADADGPAQR